MVDASGLAPRERHWIERRHGAAASGQYTLPLFGPQPLGLPGMQVSPVPLPAVVLHDLPAGDFAANWSHDGNEPPCEFTVADYRLAPLVAELIRSGLQGNPFDDDPQRLSVMLQLETFGLPVNGRVRLQIVDRGRSTTRAVPHRFAVCVRNMFEEERGGNPGPLQVTVAGGG